MRGIGTTFFDKCKSVECFCAVLMSDFVLFDSAIWRRNVQICKFYVPINTKFCILNNNHALGIGRAMMYLELFLKTDSLLISQTFVAGK